jgi:hypothetical protein
MGAINTNNVTATRRIPTSTVKKKQNKGYPSNCQAFSGI